MKILWHALLVLVLLVGSFALLGAFWHTDYNPWHSGATESSAFPADNATLLHAIIKAELIHPGVVQKESTEKTIRQDNLTWTMYSYSVHLEQPGLFTELAYKFADLVYSNGGKVFQSYFQPEEYKASMTIGVDSFITHKLAFIWDAPPVVDETASLEGQHGYARAVIVIDDLGANKQAVHRLLNLGVDFTFSILPHLEQSTEIAAFLYGQQKEVLLHLPMEPRGLEYPGKGAIMINMRPEEIQQTIEQDLLSVPYAVGVNNHMGSRLTADAEKMQYVLQTLQHHNLFFLDSRTTGSSVAYKTARQLGVRAAKRQVFLDAVSPLYVEHVKGRLRELASLAEQGLPAIAIGHPKKATLQALEEMLPEFQQRNIRIVRLSEMVE